MTRQTYSPHRWPNLDEGAEIRAGHLLDKNGRADARRGACPHRCRTKRESCLCGDKNGWRPE